MSKAGRLAAVAAVAALWPVAEARAACTGADGRSGAISLDAAGSTRSFLVRVPAGDDGRTARPVVFAFHPFGMNGAYMQSRVSSRFWPDAIMVYPDGSRTGGSGPSWQGRAGERDDADLRFFDDMLEWVGAEHCVDRARVFVLGYSNGAGFAHLLACHRREAIAGVGLAAGRATCTPNGSMPVVVGHGLRDATVGYGQAMTAAAAWSTANACASPPPGGAPGCTAARSCSAAPVMLCTHAGGHEYSPAFSRAALEFFQSVPAAASVEKRER
jgi:poly(3-hydroxybutyrate) depolymerase